MNHWRDGIIVKDEKLLTQPCREVSLLEVPKIIDSLEYELHHSPVAGVGLAAVQIGLPLKAFIIRLGAEKLNFVNATILEKYDLCEFVQEGCLSYEGIWLTTKRYGEIVVQDAINGKAILTGLTAVVFQHEFGHTNQETMFDYQIKVPKVNEECWCGSGKKYKVCHKGKVIK